MCGQLDVINLQDETTTKLGMLTNWGMGRGSKLRQMKPIAACASMAMHSSDYDSTACRWLGGQDNISTVTSKPLQTIATLQTGVYVR